MGAGAGRTGDAGGRGGGGGGDGGGQNTSWIGRTREYIGSLRNFEHSIRYNNYESLGVMDRASGKLLWSKSGEEHEVGLYAHELRSMRGRDVTHNHPLGNTFSHDDIDVLTSTEARSLRATGRRGTYILTKSKAGTRDPKNFSSAVKRAENASQKRVDKYFHKMTKNAKRTRSRDRINYIYNYLIGRGTHKWLKEHAKDYGYRYTVDRKHR